jgi:hypothetical protein
METAAGQQFRQLNTARPGQRQDRIQRHDHARSRRQPCGVARSRRGILAQNRRGLSILRSLSEQNGDFANRGTNR